MSCSRLSILANAASSSSSISVTDDPNHLDAEAIATSSAVLRKSIEHLDKDLQQVDANFKEVTQKVEAIRTQILQKLPAWNQSTPLHMPEVVRVIKNSVDSLRNDITQVSDSIREKTKKLEEAIGKRSGMSEERQKTLISKKNLIQKMDEQTKLVNKSQEELNVNAATSKLTTLTNSLQILNSQPDAPDIQIGKTALETVIQKITAEKIVSETQLKDLQTGLKSLQDKIADITQKRFSGLIEFHQNLQEIEQLQSEIVTLTNNQKMLAEKLDSMKETETLQINLDTLEKDQAIVIRKRDDFTREVQALRRTLGFLQSSASSRMPTAPSAMEIDTENTEDDQGIPPILKRRHDDVDHAAAQTNKRRKRVPLFQKIMKFYPPGTKVYYRRSIAELISFNKDTRTIQIQRPGAQTLVEADVSHVIFSPEAGNSYLIRNLDTKDPCYPCYYWGTVVAVEPSLPPVNEGFNNNDLKVSIKWSDSAEPKSYTLRGLYSFLPITKDSPLINELRKREIRWQDEDGDLKTTVAYSV